MKGRNSGHGQSDKIWYIQNMTEVSWTVKSWSWSCVRFNVLPNTLELISGTSLYGSNDPTNSVKSLKEDSLQFYQVYPTALTFTIIQQNMQYEKHKIHRHKHKWIYAQWNVCSVIKPNPEKNCSSKCAYDCAQHQYTIQHRTVLITSPLTSRQTSQPSCCLSEEKSES